MFLEEKKKFSDFLSGLAAELDIPDHVAEDVTIKYEEVGEWLHTEGSPLAKFVPEIYPQGSFRLGTVIKPNTDDGEYDIDLVCFLNIGKEQTTQADLKKMVGDRLSSREDLKAILSPSRRCWTLTFHRQFHMDVLPSIPNIDNRPTGILLTDTELTRWQKSNPKAYADWFYSKMRVILEERKRAFAESIQAAVEDVPDWQVKTPLQRAIQILKRHRDIAFERDFENRPISIIITTLAAHAYRNQADIGDALVDISRDMHKYIENREGKWWVQNPVDPGENFADKWNEKPKRREAFFAWLKSASEAFSGAAQRRTIVEAAESLSGVLGTKEVQKISESMGIKPRSGLPVAITSMIQVPALGDVGHALAPSWPTQISFKAYLRGFVYKTKGKRKLWELTTRPVPRNVWLKFILNTNTPGTYDVKWQVVNTGREAERAGQLRGDYYSSDETGVNPVRWERTEYLGTHWVEAIIFKNGVCVARTGKKMVLIR